MTRSDDNESASVPAHIKARDCAVSEAFTLIARGGVPRAIPFDDPSTYTAAVERNCVRELVGIIADWRPPALCDWRAYPEQDNDVSKQQHNTLVACLRPGDDDTSVTLFILYSGRSGTSPEMDGFDVLPGPRQQFLRSRLLGYATSDLYVEVAYVGDVVCGLAAARQLEERLGAGGALTGIARVLAGGARARQEWRRRSDTDAEPTEPDAEPAEPAEVVDSLNQPQRAALTGLRTNVELVHGPPGSGKTHTIAKLVTQYFEDDEVLILSAVQNRAIEAIAAHFVKAGVPFVTSGRRKTGLCKDWSVEAQTKRHPDVIAAICICVGCRRRRRCYGMACGTWSI